MDLIAEAFRNMDRWRHLPAYQLERRADIFFSVYLRSFLSKKLSDELDEIIVPELPIKCDLIRPGKPSSKSVKVDYALFSKDRQRSYFIELKTDSGSRREEQDDYLSRSEALGLRPIIQGVAAILRATSAHKKYFHLAELLARLGYLYLPPSYEAFVYPEIRIGLAKELAAITVPEFSTSVRVIYLQPDAAPNAIGFHEFATYVGSLNDEASRTFAKYLSRWASPAAADSPLSVLKFHTS